MMNSKTIREQVLEFQVHSLLSFSSKVQYSRRTLFIKSMGVLNKFKIQVMTLVSMEVYIYNLVSCSCMKIIHTSLFLRFPHITSLRMKVYMYGYTSTCTVCIDLCCLKQIILTNIKGSLYTNQVLRHEQIFHLNHINLMINS